MPRNTGIGSKAQNQQEGHLSIRVDTPFHPATDTASELSDVEGTKTARACCPSATPPNGKWFVHVRLGVTFSNGHNFGPSMTHELYFF
jgi:hypothetical protein